MPYPYGYPPMPNGTYPGYHPPRPMMPVQPAQNFYHGNYPAAPMPGYGYPPNYSMPAGPGNGDGITYYWVNGDPFSSPYGQPHSKGSHGRAPTYPAPVNTPARVHPPYTPIDDDLGDGSKPVVQFHRQTNESWWAKGEYLAAFIRPMRLASGPLVTTGSPADPSPGALGFPSTRILYGDDIDYGALSGARFEIGKFLDNDNCYSLDLSGFFVGPNRQSATFAGDANGNPVLARPLFDVVRGSERVFLNSKPGDITGSLTVDSKADLFGVELNARRHWYVRERLHTDVLIGFRYLHFAERLRIHEQVRNVTPGFLTFQGANTEATILDDDEFRTLNQFFGPQIGGRVSYEHNWFTLEGFAKLALGPSIQGTTINGSTTAANPDGTFQTASGGVLALPSNIGHHQRTIFGLVPELGVNLGVELTQHVRLNLGYSFLMWNHVVRPGSQYDRAVNPGQIPGSPTFGTQTAPTSPIYRFNEEFFWSHMFTIGFEIHY
jgi:hypothetical protein